MKKRNKDGSEGSFFGNPILNPIPFLSRLNSLLKAKQLCDAWQIRSLSVLFHIRIFFVSQAPSSPFCPSKEQPSCLGTITGRYSESNLHLSALCKCLIQAGLEPPSPPFLPDCWIRVILFKMKLNSGTKVSKSFPFPLKIVLSMGRGDCLFSKKPSCIVLLWFYLIKKLNVIFKYVILISCPTLIPT